MKILSSIMIDFLLVLSLLQPISAHDSLIVFENVNLISMESEGMIAAKTVIVKGQRIIQIGPALEIQTPAGAVVVDGSGSFLTPGLTDAHVHLDNKIGARPDFGDAPLYLSQGITTVFNLRGEAEHLDWKKRIKDGTLLAPNLYTAGEFVNEPRIQTAEEAENEVQRHLFEGYDLLKFREVIDFEKQRILTTRGLEKSAYLQLNESARKMHLPLVGHAPYRLGLDGLMQAGQSLAHLNELSNLFFLPPLELNQGFFVYLPRWSLLMLIGTLLLWFIAQITGLLPKYNKNLAFPGLKKVRNLSWLILLLSIICIILWILTVPPGLFFGNIWLLVLLSLIGVITIVMVLLTVIQNIKLWKESEGTVFNRILAVTVTLGGLAFSFSLIHWIPFAWRGHEVIIERVAEDCKNAGIWVQSTLICQELFMGQKDGFRREQIVEDPLFTYVPESLQEPWRAFLEYKPVLLITLWRRHPQFNQQLIFSLHRHGVPLMAGTDAMGVPLIIPGISLHKELQLLRESGLSNHEVLWTATIGPAKFLGQEDEFGSITVGKRADLLLLEKNPLDDLANLKQIKGVMVRGLWLPKVKLNQLLEAMLQRR